jgi:hypothetical protein
MVITRTRMDGGGHAWTHRACAAAEARAATRTRPVATIYLPGDEPAL